MHDNHTHPLLQQVPLTVSPFVNLPRATTLPYQYKPMPSTLPPSVTSAPAASSSSEDPSAPPTSAQAHPHQQQKPRYVVSASGHAAHPDEILEACRALHAHVTQLLARSEREVAALDERIRARELAEKRRVAPGWLDSEARLLEPERPVSVAANTTTTASTAASTVGTGANAGPAAGTGASPAATAGAEGGAGSAGDALQGLELGLGLGLNRGREQGQSGQMGMLLQQPVQWSNGSGYDGHGPQGASEMAVPDEEEQLERALGSLHVART